MLPTLGTRLRAAVPLLGITLVYAALYARVPSFEFVWDDLTTIQNNPAFDRPLAESLRVTQHGHIDETLTKLRGVAPEHESYRPLLFLTFAAEVQLFGRSAAAMHTTNAILGLLAALIAFALARSVLRSTGAGIAVAAIFALHPLMVEPIGYVSARADLLSGLLALSSAGLAWRAGAAAVRARVSLIAGACLLFAASLFVKEGTIGLPLGLAFLWLFDRRRRLLSPGLALLAVVPFYFLARASLLTGAPGMAHGGSVVRGALAVPGLALQYLTIFLAPANLSIVRPMNPAFVIAGWAAVALAAAAILWGLSRHREAFLGTPDHPGTPAAILGGLGWALALVGPSAVVAALMNVVADRYAYLPIFGFALTGVAIARFLWQAHLRWRWVMVTAGTGWALLCVSVTHLGIAAWKDPFTLYANAVWSEPQSSAAHYGIGVALARKGFWPESVRSFERAVRLDGDNMRAWNNLSVSYQTQGRLEDAERAARRAIDLSEGTHFRAWYNLASVHLTQGRQEDACSALGRSLAINPYYAKAEADAVRHCGRAPKVSAHGTR